MSPTFVFALGAWPLVDFAEPLRKAFEAKSLPFVCKVAPSPVNSNDTDKNNPDTYYLRQEVLLPLVESGNDIVLIMHSYGGVCGASAVKGISKRERSKNGEPGGVMSLIFVAAFCAPVGASTMDVMGIDPANLPDWIYHDKTAGTVAFTKAKTTVFHDMPDEQAEALANSLPVQAYSSFASPVQYDLYSDPVYEGCVGYVFTEADRIVPVQAQEAYAKTARATRTVVLKGSSHSPHIEQPNVLAETVIELTKELNGPGVMSEGV